jgi:hypothetical protein
MFQVFMDGGFGLCDGKPPTINGTVITNQYPDTVTSAAILADLTAAYLSIMKANLRAPSFWMRHYRKQR